MSKRPTDWGNCVKKDIELCEFDGVTSTTVYLGGLNDLYEATLTWRVEKSEELGELHVLKLSEIANQLHYPIITVIVNAPLHGNIYQYGNYNDGKWWVIGETMGYA